MSVELKPKGRRGLKLALMASLAVNLLVVGLVAGSFYRHGGEGRGGKGHGPNSFGAPYVRALSKEDRQAVREKIIATGEDRTGRREGRRQMYVQMVSALRAEPFTQDAMAEILRQQSEASQRFLQVSQEAWLNHVAQMDGAARAAYADRLEEALSRKKGGRKER